MAATNAGTEQHKIKSRTLMTGEYQRGFFGAIQLRNLTIRK